MKLSVRISGLCASAAFIVTALPGFYQQAKPTDLAQIATDILPGMNIIEKILISLGGAVCAGVIGYIIGDILSNPQGKKKKRKGKPNHSTQTALVASVSASGADGGPNEEALAPEASMEGGAAVAEPEASLEES